VPIYRLPAIMKLPFSYKISFRKLSEKLTDAKALLLYKRGYSLYWQISVILAQMHKTFTIQILDSIQLF
jgi:hypothetical protein